ncbi:MAG TPA: acyltransferase domain-containing protein, partial [Longimicrobiaceae bacterium]|nr:acyltransferase domain-containing protein [Longimicrobiaceae bacterium]
LWRSWGIEPAAVLGHSVGEYVAACVAGVFSLEEGLRLIAERARLMQALPQSGAMAAVFAEEEVVRGAIAPFAGRVSVAALNGPEHVVISGEGAAVQRILEELSARGIHTRPLPVSHAFHSPLVEPIQAPFAEAAASTRFALPRIPLVTNLTGRPAGAEIATPEYWTEHATAPVAFAAGIQSLRQSGCQVFVEAGPGSTLIRMGRRCIEEGLWLSSLGPSEDDWSQMLDSLAALYTAGARPDWEGFDRDFSHQKVVLPTYPFQGERYWPAEIRGEARADRRADTEPDEAADWLYQLRWQAAPRASQADASGSADPGHWLILADRGGRGAALAKRLEAQGESCTLVLARDGEAPRSAGGRHAEPTDPAALRTLVEEAAGVERPLRGIVHLWGLDLAPVVDDEIGLLGRAQSLGSTSALHLVQALASGIGRATGAPPRLWLVTRGAQAAGPEAIPLEGAAQASLWGLGKTIALEHPELWGGLIDLDPKASAAEEESAVLLAEIHRPDGEREIAFRRGERLAARVVPAGENFLPPHSYRPRADGAYLITGGLGGLGLEVARWLAGRGARRLILLGRTPLPPRAAWKQVTDGSLAAKIDAIRQLEALGASVHAAAVDVSDEAELRAFLTSYEEEAWPPIRG